MTLTLSSVTPPFYTKGDFGFEIVKSFKDANASDSSFDSLVILVRNIKNDQEVWYLSYSHDLVLTEIVQEGNESDHMYFNEPLKIEIVKMSAGPFTVTAHRHGARLQVKEVDFELNERGDPTSALIEQRWAAIEKKEAGDPLEDFRDLDNDADYSDITGFSDK